MTKERRAKPIWRAGHEAQSSTKKILPLKGDTEAVLVARVFCMASNARGATKATIGMRRMHKWRTRSGESERVLAKKYGGRCSERQHGPTNFLLRSEA